MAALQLEGALREVDELLARLHADPAARPSPAEPAAAASAPQAAAAAPVQQAAPQKTAAKAAKAEKKAAKVKAQAAAPATPDAGGSALAETFTKARLGVGRVLSVEPLANSDKLYRCKVQVGPGEERQIIAGLRKHVPVEQLQEHTVAVILNLKTAKLAGEASEGMILAAVHKDAAHEHGELVRPIQPPADAEAGDPIYLEGAAPLEAYAKEFKKWKQVLPGLAVAGGCATFEGRRLVTAAGPVAATAEMPDGSSIS